VQWASSWEFASKWATTCAPSVNTARISGMASNRMRSLFNMSKQ
jgi:hypothetical protein